MYMFNFNVSYNSKWNAFPIKKFGINGNFNVNNPWYNAGVIYTSRNIDAKQVTIDMNFDPFRYIQSQLGKEILFSYFGLDQSSLPKGELKLMTGTLSVMSGDKCSDQLQDLLSNEGEKFDVNTKKCYWMMFSLEK